MIIIIRLQAPHILDVQRLSCLFRVITCRLLCSKKLNLKLNLIHWMKGWDTKRSRRLWNTWIKMRQDDRGTEEQTFQVQRSSPCACLFGFSAVGPAMVPQRWWKISGKYLEPEWKQWAANRMKAHHHLPAITDHLFLKGRRSVMVNQLTTHAKSFCVIALSHLTHATLSVANLDLHFQPHLQCLHFMQRLPPNAAHGPWHKKACLFMAPASELCD